MTEAPEPHERPRRGGVGQPGPSWAGDGQWADEPAVHDAEEPPAVSVARERGRKAGPAGLEFASFRSRTVGFAIDNIILLIGLYVLDSMLGLNAGFPTEARTTVFLVVNLLVRVAYWWVWNTIGWSPGKRFVGLRVVDEDGAAPGLDRGFRRSVISLLSEMALYVGYLWVLWDDRNQTWHDKAGGTFVVVASRDQQRPL